jgi:hypothetical protein
MNGQNADAFTLRLGHSRDAQGEEVQLSVFSVISVAE